MTTRPLPRGLAPLDEESLPGLILRLAYRLERSPARIAELCSLNHHQSRIPAEYLIALPPERCAPFAAATRLRANEVSALTLSRISGTYPPLLTARMDGNRNTSAASKQWAAQLSSRYCPECLAGDNSPIQNLYGGPWKLRWHLPVVFSCTIHHRLLVHNCPNCSGVPNKPGNTERQGLIMQRTTSGLHPAQCRHVIAPAIGAKPAPCGTRLDQNVQTNTLTDMDIPRVLALQQRIDRRLFLDHQHSEGAQPADHHYFHDLVVAAQLIRLSWPDSAPFAPSDSLRDLIDQHVAHPSNPPSTHRRPSTMWAAPQDPAECAALLLAADTLLGEDHAADPTLIDRVQPLSTVALRRHAPNVGAALRRMQASPDLARALTPRSNGFYRAGGHHHPRQHIPSRRSQFSVQHVPALLPQAWTSAHFRDLLERWKDQSDWDVRHLRRVASLKLAEMSGGGTWPKCARELGIPWSTAQHSLRRVKEKLTPHHLWPLLEKSLEDLADHLDCDTPRIDYQHRRATLRNWRLPDADWHELIGGLGPFWQSVTSPSNDAATVLIWAEVTQGDHLHSPLLESLRESRHSTHHLVASINQIRTPANRKGAKRTLLRRIEAYATRLAPSCDHRSTSIAPGHTAPQL
ncbi:TniQ family protein [Streptomyces sp. NBC_01363]|uniref:TniQ family protein n=1 Tax=Streptomyces sp. NBC_01363 TaxID=2903840 RepID=UPI00225AF682|nr:TniQ family protein [Streptomyces sp. NBC_01363]MCX4734097.1 TniQ family protein [Streptomyces sp. NBC_01363]